MEGDNPSGGDYQQGRPRLRGTLRDCTPSTRGTRVMRQSDPHGDMGRAAEMTAPPFGRLGRAEVTDMPKVGSEGSTPSLALPLAPVTVRSAAGYMLGTPRIPRYQECQTRVVGF